MKPIVSGSQTLAAPAEGSPYKKHLPALDGIRGLAILGVMCSHIGEGKTQGIAEAVIIRVFAFGVSGVDLFFVLSGFLITGILYDSLGDPTFFRKFYARRILRIFPLYYGVLLGVLATVLFLGKNYHGQLLSFALYLQNTSLLVRPIWQYQGPSNLPLGHFWSLAVEEQFYLFWPLAVFLLRTRERIFRTAILLILLTPVLRYLLLTHGVSLLAVSNSTYCRLDTLLGGAALAMLVRSRMHDRVLQLAPWIFALGLGMLFATSFGSNSGFIPQGTFALTTTVGLSAIAMMSVGLIAMSLRQNGGVQKVFRVGFLRTLGTYSYGLYVFHFIVLDMLRPRFEAMLEQIAPHEKHAAAVTARILLLILSFGIAVASYHLYEKPFLKLKRFFEYRQPKALEQ